jgi:hypothetical protein
MFYLVTAHVQHHCAGLAVMIDSRQSKVTTDNDDTLKRGISFSRMSDLESITEWRCPICREQPNHPVCCPCGHVACWSCLSQWIARQSVCPTCRLPVNETALIVIHGHGPPADLTVRPPWTDLLWEESLKTLLFWSLKALFINLGRMSSVVRGASAACFFLIVLWAIWSAIGRSDRYIKHSIQRDQHGIEASHKQERRFKIRVAD